MRALVLALGIMALPTMVRAFVEVDVDVTGEEEAASPPPPPEYPVDDEVFKQRGRSGSANFLHTC